MLRHLWLVLHLWAVITCDRCLNILFFRTISCHAIVILLTARVLKIQHPIFPAKRISSRRKFVKRYILRISFTLWPLKFSGSVNFDFRTDELWDEQSLLATALEEAELTSWANVNNQKSQQSNFVSKLLSYKTKTNKNEDQGYFFANHLYFGFNNFL